MYHRIYKKFWPEKVIQQKNKKMVIQLNRIVVYMIIFNLCLIPFSYNKHLYSKQQIEEERRIQIESKSVLEESRNKEMVDFSVIQKISKLVASMDVKDFSYENNIITFIGRYNMLDFYLKYLVENKLELVNVERENDKDSKFVVRII